MDAASSSGSEFSAPSSSSGSSSSSVDSEVEFQEVVECNVVHVASGEGHCSAVGAACPHAKRADGLTRSHFHCPFVAARPRCMLTHASKDRVISHLASAVHNNDVKAVRQREKGTRSCWRWRFGTRVERTARQCMDVWRLAHAASGLHAVCHRTHLLCALCRVDARRSVRSVGAAMHRTAGRAGSRTGSAQPSSRKGSVLERRKRTALSVGMEDVSLMHTVPTGDAFSRENRFGVGRGSGAAKRSRAVVRSAGLVPADGGASLAASLRPATSPAREHHFGEVRSS